MGFVGVPELETLVRIATRPTEKPQPGKGAVSAMETYLRKHGYRDDNREVFEAVVRWGALELEGRNTMGLFLKGDCGIGKSLGMAFLAARFEFPVISAVDYEAAYLQMEREEFHRFIDAVDFFDRPARAVVIDDLGAESRTVSKYGTTINVMAYVLDRRYRVGFSREGARTLVACNLTDEELRDRYGERIDSRLDEMMSFAVVHGRSLRK